MNMNQEILLWIYLNATVTSSERMKIDKEREKTHMSEEKQRR